MSSTCTGLAPIILAFGSALDSIIDNFLGAQILGLAIIIGLAFWFLRYI